MVSLSNRIFKKHFIACNKSDKFDKVAKSKKMTTVINTIPSSECKDKSRNYEE
jgi:hypothetical protein